MTSIREVYGNSFGGTMMVSFEDEVRIRTGKVTREEVEHEIRYSNRWYITRVLGLVLCDFPPTTGIWSNKTLYKRIFTTRTVEINI